VSIAEGLGAEMVVDGSDIVVLRAQSGASFGPFRHVDWGTSVQCPDAVHTFQSVDSGLYLTVGDDDVVVAGAATPDGWVVRELFELHAAEGGRVRVRSNATGRYVRVVDGTLVADAAAVPDAGEFAVELALSGPAAARRAALAADQVVVVVGNDPHINGRETIDRDSLALPPEQEALIRAVHEVRPDMVLVVVSSYPYAIDWAAEQVAAVVWTCHGGQEAGTALADVLTGRRDPGGRLPQTWYSSADPLPSPEDYDIVGSGWTYQYSTRRELWPFGHGLSYANFEYGEPVVSRGLVVEVAVRNVGERAGVDVVQLYARSVDGGAERPVRRLHGFEKVVLEPGEERVAVFRAPVAEFGFWDAATSSVRVDEGRYEIQVGASARDIRATAEVTLAP
jgi:beta-glucosidase